MPRELSDSATTPCGAFLRDLSSAAIFNKLDQAARREAGDGRQIAKELARGAVFADG